jgi:hypothetical protein
MTLDTNAIAPTLSAQGERNETLLAQKNVLRYVPLDCRKKWQ